MKPITNTNHEIHLFSYMVYCFKFASFKDFYKIKMRKNIDRKPIPAKNSLHNLNVLTQS